MLGCSSLKLNVSKCIVMRFGEKVRTDTVRYRLGGQDLEFVGNCKDLGVIVDVKLRFHEHVRCVVGRASGLIGNLLRSTVCRTPDFMLTLYVTHIRPVIDYCSTVWNVGYLGDVRKMESLQRRWTREIQGMNGVCYEDRLRQLGLYSVYGRLLRKDLIKIWKVMKCENNLGVRELFDMSVDTRLRGHHSPV